MPGKSLDHRELRHNRTARHQAEIPVQLLVTVKEGAAPTKSNSSSWKLPSITTSCFLICGLPDSLGRTQRNANQR